MHDACMTHAHRSGRFANSRRTGQQDRLLVALGRALAEFGLVNHCMLLGAWDWV